MATRKTTTITHLTTLLKQANVPYKRESNTIRIIKKTDKGEKTLAIVWKSQIVPNMVCAHSWLLPGMCYPEDVVKAIKSETPLL